MQEDTQRIYSFIKAFENLYGRKPSPADAEGDFRIQVAQEMEMSAGGARYYLRLAAELEEEDPGSERPARTPRSSPGGKP